MGYGGGAGGYRAGGERPESRHQWRGLSECVGKSDPRKSCGDEIENRAETPNAAAQKSEKMALRRSAKKISEMNRLADKRLVHEVDIPDETGKQRAQRQEDGDAVWAERVSPSHGARHEGRP